MQDHKRNKKQKKIPEYKLTQAKQKLREDLDEAKVVEERQIQIMYYKIIKILAEVVEKFRKTLHRARLTTNCRCKPKRYAKKEMNFLGGCGKSCKIE